MKFISFSLRRRGAVDLGWRSSSDAVKLCWRACASHLQLFTAHFTKITSLMAMPCGKATQLWVQAGRTATPSVTAATVPHFSSCSFTVTGRDRDDSHDMSQESFPVSAWWSEEEFVASWSSLGSCAAVPSSLAKLQVRETCLFSHQQLESTQPEKGQVHIQYLLQAGARSTSETHRKEEDFALGRYLEILQNLSALHCLKYPWDAWRSSNGDTMGWRVIEMPGDTLLPDRAGKGKTNTPSKWTHVENGQFSPCSPSRAETQQWGQKLRASLGTLFPTPISPAYLK